MQILLTNDDGIFEPGLGAMYTALSEIGNVCVVAPSDSRSGAGHSISLKPLVCAKVDIEDRFTGYSVQGSPADCVKLAVMQLYHEPFDLVVAGINSGANVGINVYYSGTVAAAMEAAFLGIGSVATSLAGEETMHYDQAAGHCVEIIRKLMPVSPGDVINVNVPRLSRGRPRGIKVVPQSTEGLSDQFVPHSESDGRKWFQLAAGGRRRAAADPATDADCLEAGYITITALASDMTDHVRTRNLANMKWR